MRRKIVKNNTQNETKFINTEHCHWSDLWASLSSFSVWRIRLTHVYIFASVCERFQSYVKPNGSGAFLLFCILRSILALFSRAHRVWLLHCIASISMLACFRLKISFCLQLNRATHRTHCLATCKLVAQKVDVRYWIEKKKSSNHRCVYNSRLSSDCYLFICVRSLLFGLLPSLQPIVYKHTYAARFSYTHTYSETVVLVHTISWCDTDCRFTFTLEYIQVVDKTVSCYIYVVSFTVVFGWSTRENLIIFV